MASEELTLEDRKRLTRTILVDDVDDHLPISRSRRRALQTGNASVIGHTYSSTTTSVPCSSWGAEVVDPRELQRYYGMVVVLVEKTLEQGFA